MDAFNEKELVRNILIGPSDNSNLYLKLIPKQKIYDLVRSSLRCSPPERWTANSFNPNYLFVRWKLLCFSPIDLPILDSIDPTFFLILLKQLQINWADTLFNLFSSTDVSSLPENIGKDVANSLSLLRNQFPGLYYGLNPYVETVLVRIGARVLYETLGLEALQMSRRMDPEMLQYFRADKITSSEFMSLWQNHTLLRDSRMCTLFQSLFQCLEPFPKNSNLFKTDNLITLVNHVIIKRKKPFIDEIIGPCYNIIVEENGANACNALVSCFPELKPLIPLAFYQSLNYDSSNFIDIVNECAKNTSNVPIFDNVLKRFQNDSSLFVFLRNVTGVSIQRTDLSNMSLPYFLKQMLSYMDIEALLPFRQQEFFMIDDATRLSDFSFIFGQRCISCTIDDMKEHKSSGKFMEYLSLVQSEDVMHSLLIDLFSLIFVKEDGKYICTAELAKTIINAVRSLTSSKEFDIAKEKIDCAIALGNNEIDSCFLPQVSQLALLLDARKYEEAAEALKENKELKEIAMRALCINKMRNQDTAPFDEVKDKQMVVNDLFMSTEIGEPDYVNISEDIKTAIDNRVKDTDPLVLVDDSTIKAIIANLTEGGKPNLARYPLLRFFTEFEEAAEKINFRGHSIIEVVNEQAEKDDVESWNCFEQIVGESAVEILVKGSVNIGPNLREMLYKRCPLLSVVLSSDSTEETVAQLNNNKVISNYLKGVSQHKEYEEKDDKELMKELMDAFSVKDFDQINDLFYQMNEEEFTNEAKKVIENWKVTEIAQILPFATYRSLSLFKLDDINLEETLAKLFDEKQFYYAQIFAKEFNLFDFVPQNVQRVVSSHEFTVETYRELRCFFPDETKQIKDPSHNIEKEETESKEEIDNFQEQILSIQKEDSETKEKNSKVLSLIEKIAKGEANISSSMVKLLKSAIKPLVATLRVTDGESELYAAKTLNTICRSLTRMKIRISNTEEIPNFENGFVKLYTASRFLQEECFHHFGITYSLENLFDVEFGLFLLKTSIKYDFVNIAFDTANIYQLDSPLILSRSISCFNLGCYDEGLDELKRMLSVTNFFNNIAGEFSSDLKLSLIYRLPVDVKHCCESKTFKSPYTTINEIVEQQIGLIAGSPQIKALNDAMIIADMKHERVIFHASTGSFEEAFKAFRELGKTTTHFIKYILTPALSNMHWNVFWRYLSKNKDDLEELKPLIQDMIQFFDNKHMYYTMFDIAKRVGFNDDAIKAAILIFCNSNSWKNMKSALSDIKAIAQQAICDSNTVFYTQESIFVLLHRVELQLSIIDLFISEKRRFNIELELITSRSHTLRLGGELLVSWQLGFVNEICDFDDVNLDDICGYAIDILSSRGEAATASFIRKMRTLDESDAAMFVPTICKAFSLRISTQKQFIQFVTANVPTHELRALSFAKAGMKDNALREAKASRSNALYKRINDSFK